MAWQGDALADAQKAVAGKWLGCTRSLHRESHQVLGCLTSLIATDGFLIFVSQRLYSRLGGSFDLMKLARASVTYSSAQIQHLPPPTAIPPLALMQAMCQAAMNV